VPVDDPLDASGFETGLVEGVSAALVAGAEDVWLTLGLEAGEVAARLVGACGAPDGARVAA
jgi:hypothetical protein